MEDRITIKSFCLLFIFLFYGCYDNKFYIDVQHQKVVSCNDKSIRNLSISNEDDNRVYDISWMDNKRSVPTVINFNNIDKGYEILKYHKWKSKVIPNQDFKLLPLTKYKIKRYQGDAVSQKIDITTNDKGEIFNSSKVDCE
jgi:hypothetical protein